MVFIVYISNHVINIIIDLMVVSVSVSTRTCRFGLNRFGLKSVRKVSNRGDNISERLGSLRTRSSRFHKPVAPGINCFEIEVMHIWRVN